VHIDQIDRPFEAAPRGRMRWLVWLLAGFGFAACALLLRELGAREVWAVLRELAPLVPALFALECVRVACEVFGTAAVLGPARARLPWLRLLRGQFIAQSLDVVMPAGRASAEAAKAAVFAPAIGLSEALAAATVLQLAVLFCNVFWSFAGFAVSGALPFALRAGLVVYACAVAAVVVAVVAFAGSSLARRLSVRISFVHGALERFAALLRERPRALLWPLLAQLFARACQAAQIGLLLSVLSQKHSIGTALLGEAVYLVGAALGELVPAQVGTTDGAFVIAAGALGLQAQGALALALALHAVQVVTACVTALLASALWLFGQVRESSRLSYQLPLQRHNCEREFG
jgi:uncharacterized membrane protein YbhN (UPF0104 family)